MYALRLLAIGAIMALPFRTDASQTPVRPQFKPSQQIALRWTYRLPAASGENFHLSLYGVVTNVVTSDTIAVRTERDPKTRNARYFIHGLRRSDGMSVWQSEQFASYCLSPLHSGRVVFFVSTDGSAAPPNEVYAVEAATGRELWKRGVKPTLPGTAPADELPCQLAAVSGNVTALIRMGSQQVELARTETGSPLEAAVPADKQTIDQAIIANGATIPVIPFDASRNFRYISRQPFLLHLNPPNLTPISLAQIVPYWYHDNEFGAGIISVVGATQSGKLVLYIDEDTGGAGQSSWPKYLVGTDETGKKRWQFPAHILRDDNTGAAKGAGWLQKPTFLPGSNIIVAEDEDRVLYGVCVSDGRQLWTHKSKSVRNEGWNLADWTANKNSVFALRRVEPSGKSNAQKASLIEQMWELVAIDGQSGRVRSRAQLYFRRPAEKEEWNFRLAVEGNDLYIITPREIRAYDCRRLLTTK